MTKSLSRGLRMAWCYISISIFVLVTVGCGGQESSSCGEANAIDIGQHDFFAGLRGNSSQRDCMSGISILQNTSVPDVIPNRDPNTLLNFEHILTGFPDGEVESGFTPREGKYPMRLLSGGQGVQLTRTAEDEPWGVSSTLQYRFVAPNYIDFDFNVQFDNPSLFKPDAVFFFASYMNWVPSPEINFMGFSDALSAPQWVMSKANQFPGESYIAKDSVGQAFDVDAPAIVKMNFTHELWPRVAEPFYYGMAGGGSVYALMFDQLLTPETEVRFSVMRWELKKRPSPAWDFAWVVRAPKLGQKARLRGRLLFKPFVSADDILSEYTTWRKALP